MNRHDVLDFLAANVPKSISNTGVSRVIPEFFEMLHEYLDFNDPEMATIFGVTTAEIKKKRKTVEERDVLHRTGDKTLTLKKILDEEDFMSKSIDEKIIFIDKKLDLDIIGIAPLDDKQKKSLQSRREDLMKDREREIIEGKSLIVKLLDYFRHIFIPKVKATFDGAFKNMRREIADNITTSILNEAIERGIISKGDRNRIKDEMFKKAYQIADMHGKDFDIGDIFNEVGMKEETVRQSIDLYLERSGAPKFVGGGVIKSQDSKTGGAQYKQQKKEAKREREF